MHRACDKNTQRSVHAGQNSKKKGKAETHCSWCAQELVPKEEAATEWRRTPLKRAQQTKASDAQVRAQADFRNQAFLNRFITELGRLPPKRVTRLQRKTHLHLCRTIKARAPGQPNRAHPALRQHPTPAHPAAVLITACALVGGNSAVLQGVACCMRRLWMHSWSGASHCAACMGLPPSNKAPCCRGHPPRVHALWPLARCCGLQSLIVVHACVRSWRATWRCCPSTSPCHVPT
jgi:ribosomal protein S18